MLSWIVNIVVGVCLLTGSGLVWSEDEYRQSAPVLDRSTLDYDRFELTTPDKIQKIKHASNRLGLGGSDGWGVTGWFEYDFNVAQSGWYELNATIAGSYKHVEYIVDPSLYRNKTGGSYFYSTGQGFNGKFDKVSNVWLSAGPHTIRVQQYYWTGFPAITNIAIKPSTSQISERLQATLPGGGNIFRKDDCRQLELFYSSHRDGENLTVWIRDAVSGLLQEKTLVSTVVTKGPQKKEIPLYCRKEGTYRITIGDGAGRAISKRDVGEIVYEVIDTSIRVKTGGDIAKTLIQEIDCAVKPPDYTGGGATHLVHQTFGDYRESGDADWNKYQQLSTALRLAFPEPSWFAYKLKIPRKQRPYIVEVDYPDDHLRSFAIVLREGAPLTYPVAGGVDSGGEFSLSHSMAMHTLIFWPRDMDTRIVFMNARPGNRAAAAKIRVFQLEDEIPALLPPIKGGRDFANWYEEGPNFIGIYGAPNKAPDGSRIAMERWASAVSYMGGNILSPTVNIYSFALYPSQFNRAFSEPPNNDVLRRMLLVAEKYGMKLLPDIHPRADELAWPYAKSPDPKPNLLVSKDGVTRNNLPPYYNPLYPANQNWYVNMIGELADNYKDSPALMGVSLRLMQWQNPTLNNFHSLDWGYDDYTIGLFQKETGMVIPGALGDQGRFRKRYDWIIANAKDKWIAWRCQKIAQLYTRIRDRVRQARPDLKVYSYAFDGYPSQFGAEWLKGAGIDAQMLSGVEGVSLVNSLHAYGRRYDVATTQGTRDNLLDPNVLKAFSPSDRKFMSYSRYFEANDVVVPPEKLGFGPATQKVWTSAVINPAGRNFLERYAVILAETDATLLGDGGNGYSIGQPLLREFLQEYRVLPATPFTMRQDARDPVAIWELPRAKDFLFYMVNRESFPISIRVNLKGAGDVNRLSTGQKMKTDNRNLDIVLQPYQLISFVAAANVRIAKVQTSVPNENMGRVAAQVNWLSALASTPGIKLTPEQRGKLNMTMTKAREALHEGWVWRARTLMENHEMLSTYKGMGQYPPRLRENLSNE